jgi:hypothetical protein
VPEEPVIFMKPISALLPHGGVIEMPEGDNIHYEAEICVVIGKRAQRISRDDAADYILGYTCGNDVSHRDFQRKDGQWVRAKGHDTFCPLGPVIETDMDPGAVKVQSRLNGQIKQDSNTEHLIFNIPFLVEFISGFMTLEPGDVILIEQQTPGPNYIWGDGQYGLVPVEWVRPWYDDIVLATGNDYIVVQAAGNGSENLDAPEFSIGNGGHHPFLPGNNSGAIIVGAGAAPPAFGGSDAARSRLNFSNYGSRLNVQGWGQNVMTTGYGQAYNEQGKNLYYTAHFSGTSSASPFVASAAALIQSIYKEHNENAILTPDQMRDLLISTGTPQTNGLENPARQHIGPLPDIKAALSDLFGVYIIHTEIYPPETGSVSGSGIFLPGETVTLHAQSTGNAPFTGWSEKGEEVVTDAGYTFTANGNRTLTAHFDAYKITTSGIPAGTGSFISGSGTFAHNEIVELSASPSGPFFFIFWF